VTLILILSRPERATRARRAKKTPDRIGPKQIVELGELIELAELRGDSRQTVKTDTDKSDTGRQLK
jgi:hypothetical protein